MVLRQTAESAFARFVVSGLTPSSSARSPFVDCLALTDRCSKSQTPGWQTYLGSLRSNLIGTSKPPTVLPSLKNDLSLDGASAWLYSE
eukprot:1088864-Karenia_brevis.AAC.1